MQNRLLIIIAAGVVVLGGAAALLYFSRPPAGAPAPAPPVAARATAPAATPAPASSPAPAPAATPASPKPAALSPTPEPVPTTGTLIIESDVPDTGVFLDRAFVGTAPITVPNVAPGQHTINLSATGYDRYDETIDVAPGTRTISARFKEIRLDAALAVVHKHGIGSCAGTLRATPQGLTYGTTNKNDAFTAALTDLETFTMDYLEKNLRVKIKGGKAYTFADPEGNVNRLYLFHQDVDKARQRLLAGR